MQINQLKCFVIAAKYGSITKAAEQMFVSQPAISASILQLEKELGVKLFERANKKIMLSPVGKKVLVSAQMILDEYSAIIIDCSHRKENSKTVTFAAPVFPKHILQIVSGFRAEYPDIALVQTAASGASPEIMMNATLDENFSDTRRRILTEDFGFIVPTKHPLMGHAQIELKEMATFPIISLSKNFAVRKAEDYYYNVAGFTPIREREVTALSTLLELIYAEAGIIFSPLKTWGTQTISTDRIIRIRNPRCHRYVFAEKFLYPNSDSEAVDAFLDFVTRYFQKE